MEVIIRQEIPADVDQVRIIVEEAFKEVEISDHSEHQLVDRLRRSSAFIPELSIVALCEDDVVGHVLLTEIRIVYEMGSVPSLALAPLSVKPDFQGRGIGGHLILTAHKVAEEMRYTSVILLGHETYYPKFGYEQTSKYGIEIPFEAPDENCMVKVLEKDALPELRGKVVYSSSFFEL